MAHFCGVAKESVWPTMKSVPFNLSPWPCRREEFKVNFGKSEKT
jgi:hypothetical protein